MGLDAVELIMAMEECFHIDIPDSDAGEADTVGKVVDLIYSRLRKKPNDLCPSQHSFYIIRKQIINQLGLPRSAIRLDTRLDDIIPDIQRRDIWKTLIQSFPEGISAPALVRPKWLNWIVLLILPVVAFGITFIWLPLSLFWLGFFPAFITGLLGDIVTTPLKTRFRPEYSCIKDLLQFVRPLDRRTWSKEEVFKKVKEISAEILYVKQEDVKMESHWIKDLGVG